MANPVDQKALKKIIEWLKSVKVFVPENTEKVIEMRKLDLRMRDLNKLPDEISVLANLEELDLGYNRFSELPSHIGLLRSLKELRLESNRFSKMPSIVSYFENLEYLDLQNNQLTSLPPEIRKLRKLQTLNVQLNQLTKIPDEIGELTELRHLNISANKLTEVPVSISNLTNLETLDLWSNKIIDIPDKVRELPKLHEIDMVLNQHKLNHKLIEAVIDDNLNLAKELISHGANVNYKWLNHGGHQFTSALFEATSVEMVKMLLENHADVQMKREIVKQASIFDFHDDTHTGKFETFLTMKHSIEVAKYIKSINLK